MESLPERFAAPGGPGFVSDLHMGTGLPLTYFGLVAGAVTLRDGLLPQTRPWPGLDEIAAPRAWYDSSATLVGEGGGWRGFSASLVELRGMVEPPVGRKPRAAFTFVNGTSAVARTGLLISRGGDAAWARAGALTEQRSGAGLLGTRGQHVWLAELGRRLGAHTFSGRYSQRGLAGGTRPDARFVSGFAGPPFIALEEAARGEAGDLSWRWTGRERSLTTTLSRSHDHRESLESELNDFGAERESQDDGVVVEASAGAQGRSHGLRFELRRAQVRRSADTLSVIEEPAFEWDERSAWLAVRDERPLAGGSLEVQLGGGHTSSPDTEAERWQAAPSAVWRVGPARRNLRLYAERLVMPVWSDLAPGVRPFVQDTWVGGLEANVGEPGKSWLRVGALAAEIGNRASLVRFPVRDVALRFGFAPDAFRLHDAMVTLAAGARRSGWAIEAAGFSRVRPIGTQPSRVDPGLGASGAAETAFRLFSGDLGVTLRFESAWVGEREYRSFPGYFGPPKTLPGYVTYAGSVALTLGDARVVVRGANLEDEPHPQVWTDPSSPFLGEPAAGAARQVRVELVWPLFN